MRNPHIRRQDVEIRARYFACRTPNNPKKDARRHAADGSFGQTSAAGAAVPCLEVLGIT